MRDPRIGATEPERRPYYTAEQAAKAVAEKTWWEPIHVERVGPLFDDRSLGQRRRDDLLAAVTAFIDEVDRSDFKDAAGRMLIANERLAELRVLTLS